MSRSGSIRVEVVCVDERQRQRRCVVDVPAGATAGQAIAASGILDAMPADFAPAAVGVFGNVVALDAPLDDGDRIELYRPLRVDPKEARRHRAVQTQAVRARRNAQL